jgi:radical SAM protein with 4Fe4S-binding SPASM domain
VLMKKNLGELPGLIRLAGELGAVDVVPMPVDGQRAERPSAAEIAWFNRDIVPEIVELRRAYGMPFDAARLYPFGRSAQEIGCAVEGKYAFGYYDKNPCYAPYLHAFVSHTGDVFACCMMRDKMAPLGNVQQQSLADIFHAPQYEVCRRRMQHQRLRVCANCDMFLRDNRLVRDRLEEQQTPQPLPHPLEGVA